MDRKLLDILVCPATRQPLALLSGNALEALNQAIAQGEVRRFDDVAQVEAIHEGLVTRDGKRVYRVDDGIPVLLVEEGLQSGQVVGIAAVG